MNQSTSPPPRWLLPVFWVAVVVLLVVALVAGASNVGAAEPTPSLSITKDCGPQGAALSQQITCTIDIVNAGDADSSQVTVLDTLPATGIDWLVQSTVGLECSIADDGLKLTCTGENVARRHINQFGTDFENGFAEVVVRNFAGGCGESYLNRTAELLAPEWGIDINSGPALIQTADCPTPTPTPTQPPTTPTQTPTTVATETPTATQTPVVIVVIQTPSSAITPKPPATGSGAQESSDRGVMVPWLFAGLGITCLAFGTVAISAVRHKRRE